MRRRRDEDFPDNGFEAWGGYMQAKIAKLEDQLSDAAAANRQSDLFQGISIFVNGYTNPSASELKLLMSLHGGVYHTYQRNDDYVIASNLPDTKVKRLTSTKVVRPQWITESLAANRLLDYKDFLLYSKHTRTQPKLRFDKNTTNDPTSITINKQSHNSLESFSETKPANSIFNAVEPCNVSSSIVTVTDLKSSTESKHSNGSFPPNEIPACDIFEEINSEIKLKDNDVNILPNVVSISKSTLRESPKELLIKPYDINRKPSAIEKDVSAQTAVNPNFMSEYYNNSRLHHISQLSAGFKQYINELRDASDFNFPARSKLKEMINSMTEPTEPPITVKSFSHNKVIMHIDMDCFFVSVGLRNRPELRGVPVAVTHAKNTQSRPQNRQGMDREAEFNLYRQRKARSLSKATGISQETLFEEDIIKTRVDDVVLVQEGNKYNSLSEIASCSYEARAKGIRNGMFMGSALKLCPDLKTIPYDFEGYKEVAYTLYSTLTQYTLDIEAVSCDEMYVECTDLISDLEVSVQQFASTLRQEIRTKTGCPCSTGFGGNRLQARLSTKKAKPNGQFFLMSHLVDFFMMDVKFEDLPGVGRQLQQQLATLCGGAATCGAIRHHTLASLQKHLGNSMGRTVYNYCRGDDQKPLSFVTVRKSVSAEVNYGIRFENQTQCDTFLRQLCNEIQDRMKKFKVIGKSITLKLMIRAKDAPVETAKFMGHGFCDTVNKTASLLVATDDLYVITREVLQLCQKQNVDPREMRGIGIQISKLESSVRQQSKNAIDAFLVKSGSNLKTNKLFENKNIETPIRYNEEIKDQNAKENAIASWILRTPPKNIITDKHTTPIKSVHTVSPTLLKRSPLKSPTKSPPKKKCLGLTGRRRGRPPRSSYTNVGTRTSASSVVMNNFLMGERETPRQEPSHIEKFDPDILAALPEDIRNEVLEHYQMSVSRDRSRPHTPVKTKQEEMYTKLINTPKRTTTSTVKSSEKSHDLAMSRTQESNVMVDMFNIPWEQVREMLRAWLEAGTMPMQCDVDLISTYMQNIVINRNIDKVMILINFLRRKIGEMNDTGWSRVYTHIIEGIQQTMLAVYGKRLLIDQ